MAATKPRGDLGGNLERARAEVTLAMMKAVGMPRVTLALNNALNALATAHGAWLKEVGAHEVGLSTGEMSSGELELKLSIDGRKGSCFLSREMWTEMGRLAGWAEDE